MREGIITSERVNKLDAPAEVFYRRLMSKVDDHGLYDARPPILRTYLYPLRVDRVREADITRWLAACEKAGLIALYSHDGKPYLQMLDTRWSVRSEPKYPLPSDPGSTLSRAAENRCKQVKAVVPVFGVVGVVGDVACAAPAGALFDEFWKAYPKKKAKDDARKAFDKRQPTRQLLDAMLKAIRLQAVSVDWLKDGGQFIPYPASWLNAGRWQDGEATDLVVPENPQVAETRRRLEAEANRKIATPDEVRALRAQRMGAAA
jgi:hypothetical protein